MHFPLAYPGAEKIEGSTGLAVQASAALLKDATWTRSRFQVNIALELRPTGVKACQAPHVILRKPAKVAASGMDCPVTAGLTIGRGLQL